MIKRKLMALLMCSVMALGLVACGSNDDEKETETTTENSKEDQSKDDSEKETSDDSATGTDEAVLKLALNVMFNDEDSAPYHGLRLPQNESASRLK